MVLQQIRPVQPIRHRFTTDEYDLMGRAGVFTEDDRVELIDGEIFNMAAIGPRHATTVSRLNRNFSRRLPPDRAFVSIQNPVRLSGRTEPEPDVVISRPKSDDYASGHPTPPDVLLIVEVADSTIAFDRDVKIPIYARDNVQEAWLADLNQDAIVVYREPSPAGYRHVRTYRRGDEIAPLAFPEHRFAVADLLAAPEPSHPE